MDSNEHALECDKENLSVFIAPAKHGLNSPLTSKAKLKLPSTSPLETPLGDKDENIKYSKHLSATSKVALKDITNIAKHSSPSRLRNKLLPDDEETQVQRESKPSIESELDAKFFEPEGKILNAEYAPPSIIALDDFENELEAPVASKFDVSAAKMGSISDDVDILIERELPSSDEL